MVFQQAVPLVERNQRKVTVEVRPGGKVEAALQFPEMRLRRADRVGLRHDGDVAEDVPVGIGLAQPFAEEVDQRRAGQFIGVQRCLDMDGRRLRVAALETEDGHAPFDAGRITANDDL